MVDTFSLTLAPAPVLSAAGQVRAVGSLAGGAPVPNRMKKRCQSLHETRGGSMCDRSRSLPIT
jgi:hypothetical protein